MKICVLTHREALLLERDGKKPLCHDPLLGRSPHRHIEKEDIEDFKDGTARVKNGEHKNLEFRFVDDYHRRGVWIACRKLRVVGQTKFRPNSKESKRFMQPGMPVYNLVRV
jgi:hypothetical protein